MVFTIACESIWTFMNMLRVLYKILWNFINNVVRYDCSDYVDLVWSKLEIQMKITESLIQVDWYQSTLIQVFKHCRVIVLVSFNIQWDWFLMRLKWLFMSISYLLNMCMQ